MKTLNQTCLALGICIAGTTLLPMTATAMDFRFSFENALNAFNGNGTVTGVIRGLDEGTRASTSVEVLSNTAGFGIGEYIGNPNRNSWTVLDGNLIAFDFLSFGVSNTPPAVTNATLFFNSSDEIGASFRAGISSSPNGIVIGSSGITTKDINLTFTRLDNVKSVPEPTSILSLFAVGAVAIGTTLKRKQA